MTYSERHLIGQCKWAKTFYIECAPSKFGSSRKALYNRAKKVKLNLSPGQEAGARTVRINIHWKSTCTTAWRAPTARFWKFRFILMIWCAVAVAFFMPQHIISHRVCDYPRARSIRAKLKGSKATSSGNNYRWIFEQVKSRPSTTTTTRLMESCRFGV